jgi:CDP-glucose 4,6-dehydratase
VSILSLKVMNNKKILITGVTGLLGSWLAEKLLEKNCSITGLALNSELDFLINSKNINNNIDMHYFDISEEDKLLTIFNKEYDLVIHLAAQTQVGDAIKDPIHTFKSNIQGTWNILELCRLNDTPIVVASSDKAYGESELLPYEETFSLNGEYPYEVSKSATDLLCKTYKTTYDLNVATLRCGNIYGGGDLNWERLIPGVIRWLISNETPVLRTNGTFKRDWVYVEDVVQAYIAVGAGLLDSQTDVSAAYNFSSTDYLSVSEIYKKIVSQFSSSYIDPIIQEDSKYEIKDQYLSSKKIKEELGVSSKFNIDSGLEKTISWYKEHLKNI